MQVFSRIFLILTFLATFGCRQDKEDEWRPAILKSLDPSDCQTSMIVCDDTSGYKNPWDLFQYVHLKDCFLCNATKEVPGLGVIPWVANNKASIGNNFLSVKLETYQQWGESMVLREEIVFSVPPNIGTHQVEGGYYIRTLSDGDVIGAIWKYDTLCTNFVDVKQLDLECEEVRGEFELHFLLDDPKGIDQPSEHIKFVNGKFEARIKQN